MDNTYTYLQIAIASIALITFIVKTVKRLKDMEKQDIIIASMNIIEEAIALAAYTHNTIKRDAAISAGQTLRKSPEMSKDPVKTEKIFREVVKPARQMIHDEARKNIRIAIEDMPKSKLKKGIEKVFNYNKSSIDQMIHSEIAGKKEGIPSASKSIITRNLLR